MDIIKEAVSKNKKRYTMNGFNLDLSYITSRIIAMSYPASGLEKLFRNSIDDVSSFLEKQHHNNYLIVNLSGRGIDESKLKSVMSFPWQDHKSPSIDVIFSCCQKVGRFLQSDRDSIAAIHCNQGKGRTGTLITCFLLYCNRFQKIQQALNLYDQKRFMGQQKGVTQPCQRLYIDYFYQILKNPKMIPKVLSIKKIIFTGTFKIENVVINIKNISTKALIYSTKNKMSQLQITKQHQKIWKINDDPYCVGDIVIEIVSDTPFSQDKPVGSYFFNTMFIPFEQIIIVKLKDISPKGSHSKGYFGQDFCMQLHFRRVCSCPLNSYTTCQRCAQLISPQQQKMQAIKQSILYRENEILKNNLELTQIEDRNSKNSN